MTAGRDPSRHRDVVRESFERQAEEFSRSPVVTDASSLEALLRWTKLGGDERVLDVACGPGVVAAAFAPHARFVIGVDLTPAMLRRAIEVAREKGARNTAFVLGDGERVPFADGSFERVISRRSFHHFPDPRAVLRDMARVCAPGGAVVIEDQAPPSDPEAAATMTAIERLRDPSHTEAVQPDRWEGLFRDSGLRLDEIALGSREMDVEEWMTRAHPAPADAARARELLESVARGERPGPPVWREDGALRFRIGTQLVRGTVPSPEKVNRRPVPGATP